MFRCFSRTIIRHKSTCLKHKYVCKLNIIRLRAQQFYILFQFCIKYRNVARHNILALHNTCNLTQLLILNCYNLLSIICYIYVYTEWRTKCHTIDYARNTFLLFKKHLTSGTELILIGWKIVPNEEHVQCDHRFASRPFANEPLHSS